MALAPRGHEYPTQKVEVLGFPPELHTIFPRPDGFILDWPPTQLRYLGHYLKRLGCRTVVIESHYIDRDHVDDTALFYARSLRGYPNYCQRIHFFTKAFDLGAWKKLIGSANHGRLDEATSFLQKSYLGFTVVKPLPGSPVGRTVLATFPSEAGGDYVREFGAVREYKVHLAGMELTVQGLAFQQQDRGVSACATTALWSALQRIAHSERLPIPTPAEITEAASRYFLAGGRSLPSEGLTVHQISEATRAAGLAPLVVPGVSLVHDRAQLLGYIRSGFAPVVAIQPVQGGEGHAVCGVGLKLGHVDPPTDPAICYRDGASAVKGIYIHDDRLGPYAAAVLKGLTKDKQIVTALSIAWPEVEPGKEEGFDDYFLRAVIVPVPRKVRLALTQVRVLGLAIAQAVGKGIYPEFKGQVTLNSRFRRADEYRASSYTFGLSNRGVESLVSKLVLSRYLGVIELTIPAGPLLDVLIDSTETQANPSVLACVRRSALPAGGESKLRAMASKLGAVLVA